MIMTKKMQITRNFNLSEFECKCGCEMPDDVLENIKKLAEELQVVRDYVHEPININSAYRCKKHNRSIGSKDTSQHVLGKAADITIKHFTPDEVFDVIQNLRRNPMIKGVKFQGIGRYNTFTHVDLRKYYSTWDYRL